jgi:hypothetical protein
MRGYRYKRGTEFKKVQVTDTKEVPNSRKFKLPIQKRYRIQKNSSYRYKRGTEFKKVQVTGTKRGTGFRKIQVTNTKRGTGFRKFKIPIQKLRYQYKTRYRIQKIQDTDTKIEVPIQNEVPDSRKFKLPIQSEVPDSKKFKLPIQNKVPEPRKIRGTDMVPRKENCDNTQDKFEG